MIKIEGHDQTQTWSGMEPPPGRCAALRCRDNAEQEMRKQSKATDADAQAAGKNRRRSGVLGRLRPQPRRRALRTESLAPEGNREAGMLSGRDGDVGLAPGTSVSRGTGHTFRPAEQLRGGGRPTRQGRSAPFAHTLLAGLRAAGRGREKRPTRPRFRRHPAVYDRTPVARGRSSRAGPVVSARSERPRRAPGGQRALRGRPRRTLAQDRSQNPVSGSTEL